MQASAQKNGGRITAMAAYGEILQKSLERALEEFHRHGEKIILAKGDILVSQKVHCLEKGKCALCVNDPRGEPISIFYFRPGQLINFLPLFAKCFPFDDFIAHKKVPTDMFHVKALSDCQLIVVDSDWVLNAFISDSAIANFVTYSCIVNLLNVYMCVHNCPILSNAQRICLLIISSIEEQGGNMIPEHLTHVEISRHLSIHPITVAKIFSKLRNMGVIEKAGSSLRIKDMDTLRAIAKGCQNISY